MKELLNSIYRKNNQYKQNNKVFEKGWSFSTQNPVGKDGRILFV